MQNKKQLVALSLLRKIIEIFFDFFLGVYLFKLTSGDLNFILLYAAVSAIAGVTFSCLLMFFISKKTANLIFRSSYICQVLSLLMLLIFKENILDVIWIFLLLSRYTISSYYAVWETTLIDSTGKSSLSSYIAGVNILSTTISLAAPAFLGFIITDSSYYFAIILVLVSSLISIFIATKTKFSVINSNFRPLEYWKKAAKNRSMRKAYATTFLKRLAGPEGILAYLVPILLVIVLGTEFSAGSYDSLFSIGYIILLEIVRVINKKGLAKRFYVPLALLCLFSAIAMVSVFNSATILIFYFTLKTGAHLIQTESASLLYAISRKEGLKSYTREHRFTWNIFLALGDLTGISIAYIVYNYFYSENAFAITTVILMLFFVLQSYLLQNLESKLKNA